MGHFWVAIPSEGMQQGQATSALGPRLHKPGCPWSLPHLPGTITGQGCNDRTSCWSAQLLQNLDLSDTHVLVQISVNNGWGQAGEDKSDPEQTGPDRPLTGNSAVLKCFISVLFGKGALGHFSWTRKLKYLKYAVRELTLTLTTADSRQGKMLLREKSMKKTKQAYASSQASTNMKLLL